MSGDLAAPRRTEALAYIIERIIRTRTSPSAGDIGRALGISRTRAQQLTNELIRDRVLERIPGTARGLRIRDLVHCRHMIAETLREFGASVAEPMGVLMPPLSNSQIPVLPLIVKDGSVH